MKLAQLVACTTVPAVVLALLWINTGLPGATGATWGMFAGTLAYLGLLIVESARELAPRAVARVRQARARRASMPTDDHPAVLAALSTPTSLVERTDVMTLVRPIDTVNRNL